MNLLADEGVDGPVIERLRQDGHAVLYVAEMEPGISDGEILRKANEQGSLLVTSRQRLWRDGISSKLAQYGWSRIDPPGRTVAGGESSSRQPGFSRPWDRDATSV